MVNFGKNRKIKILPFLTFSKNIFFKSSFASAWKHFFFLILKILQLSFNLLFLPLKNIYNWLIYGKMKKVGKNCSFCPYMDQITVSRTDKLKVVFYFLKLQIWPISAVSLNELRRANFKYSQSREKAGKSWRPLLYI